MINENSPDLRLGGIWAFCNILGRRIVNQLQELQPTQTEKIIYDAKN